MNSERGIRVECRGRVRAFAALLILAAIAIPVAAQSGDDDFIKPSRPTAANPAEIQQAGVLQLEYGFDTGYRAEKFRSQYTAPLALRFAATERLLLEVDLDMVKSEVDSERRRMTGVGDTRVGLQVVALKDAPSRPALAFAYYAKLPSASDMKQLGTGKVDHKAMVLISKKFGGTDIDFNLAYLDVGREDGPGRKSGVYGALAFAQELTTHFGAEAEVSGQSQDDVQPKGAFATGALTYKAGRRVMLDAGLRLGLNRDAPRAGFLFGITVGVANFYRK
jgi:hypothetical protein